MLATFLLPLLVRGPSPKATVEALVKALNAGDLKAMTRQIAGNPRPEMGSASDLKGAAKIQATVEAVVVTGDEATAEVDLRIVGPDRTLASHESAHFRRIGGDWRLVPTPLTDPTAPTLSMIASLLVDPPKPTATPSSAVEPKASPVAIQSLNNVRRLGLAMLMYAADHDDRLPQATEFKASIASYVKDPTIFTAPGVSTGTLSYFMDPRLSGVRLGSLSRPADAALVIEGTDAKAAFPYAERGAIAYADGHAKLVNREAAYAARTVPLGV